MLLYFIMIVAAVGMIIGLVQGQRGAPWGRPVTIACAVVALLMAIGTMFRGGDRVDVRAIRRREAAYQRIAMERLGQHLAEAHSGFRALVVKPIEFGDPTETTTAQLDGLRAGLGGQIEIVAIVSPEIPEEFRQMMEHAGEDMDMVPMPPMADMSMMQADSFNAGVNDYLDDVDLVISLVGLPMDMQNLSIWRKRPPPKLAVYGFPHMPGIKEAIGDGYIVAFVTHRPDPDPEAHKVMPRSIQDFDTRYILITPENIQEISTQHPMLLPEYQ